MEFRQPVCVKNSFGRIMVHAPQLGYGTEAMMVVYLYFNIDLRFLVLTLATNSFAFYKGHVLQVVVSGFNPGSQQFSFFELSVMSFLLVL
jgi:hypothetical protein